MSRLPHALLVIVATLTSATATLAVRPPNILLLFPDQWRWDWASTAYGVPLRMPIFDALAANGTRFSQAYVPSPLCAPSRACLASGREYDYAGVPDNFSNDYPLNETTIYSLLAAAGYRTMTAGKDDLTKASGPGINGTFHETALGFVAGARTCGKDDVLSGGVPHDPYGAFCNRTSISVDGREETLWHVLQSDSSHCCSDADGAAGYDCTVPTEFPQPDYEDQYIAAGAISLLDARPPGVPWFLQVNFAGPHPPFIVTAGLVMYRVSPISSLDYSSRDLHCRHDEPHSRSIFPFRCGQQESSTSAAGAAFGA